MADLHRQLHNDDLDAILKRVVPKDCYSDVMKAIQKAYQIDIDEQECFIDFQSVGEYFLRNFTYRSDENSNIFAFETPNPNKHQSKHANKGGEANFFNCNRNCFQVSFNDIKLLFDNKVLTKGIINFVLDVFNFYAINSTSDDTVPDWLFGNHKIMQAVVPHKQNYHTLWEYYSLIQDDVDKLDDNALSYIIKHWYIKHKKRFLSDIIAKYQQSNMCICNFIIMNEVTDRQYILVNTNVSAKGDIITDSRIETIDLKNSYRNKTTYRKRLGQDNYCKERNCKE